MATMIIAALIGIYCAWVIRKKYREMKKGKFCSCGCGKECPGCREKE